MNSKPVIARAAAEQDVDQALEHYLSKAGEKIALGFGEKIALGFIDALEDAYAHISRHPAAGSPRYAHELGLPGLRCWGLRGYPHLIFYSEKTDIIDIWRVLHGQRDIPEWMREPA